MPLPLASLVLALALCCLLVPLGAAANEKRPEELGDVSWLRDLDKATAQAKKTGKPILLLFQEVPG